MDDSIIATKAIAVESQRLKRLYADVSMENNLLKGVLRRK